MIQVSSITTLPRTVVLTSSGTATHLLASLAAASGEVSRASTADEVEGAVLGGARLVIVDEGHWRRFSPRLLAALEGWAKLKRLRVIVLTEKTTQQEALPPPVHLVLCTSVPTAEAERAIYELLAAQGETTFLPVPPATGRVLVVDDSELLNRITSSVLGQAGYEVTCTTNPFELYRLIGEFSPDLVLVDYNIPTLQGNTLIQIIRRAGVTVPLVLYSNASEEVLHRVMQECGANGYLRKSAGVARLLAKLDLLFRQFVAKKAGG